MCRVFRMHPDDDAVVREFIERLDQGELDEHLADELAKLTYGQQLSVAQIITERMRIRASCAQRREVEQASRIPAAGGGNEEW